MSGGDLLAAGPVAVAILDGFPVNPGHTLIIPRRHVPGWFELSDDEQAAVWRLVPEIARLLEERHHPAGFNIGINCGRAAGQTVDHVHLHVIPRFTGDVDDPRGGVRWVIPARARYWDS
ncbi:MAG TPA: HIT family protein [Polyangia bacterium]